MYGLFEAAQRSVSVLDSEGTVTHRWVREGDTPEFGESPSEVRDAVERTVESETAE